jgi:hypothetical protein
MTSPFISFLLRCIGTFCLPGLGCLLAQSPGTKNDLASVVNSVSTGVAAVGQIETNGSGAPVVMLDELHGSRAAQIQGAILLVRLYSKYGLRDIALEGYLKETPPIDGRWFTDRWKDLTSFHRARVAVRLLKEGEISGAEFAKLTYPDLRLHPVERRADHDVQLQDSAFQGLDAVAIKLGRKAEVDKMLEEAGKGVPFTVSKQLAMAEEMDAQRVARSISLSPVQLQNWKKWLDFWRGRARANDTMFAETISAMTGSKAAIIVMNIGRAHTDDTIALFKKTSRPYAVITPLAIKNNDKRGDLGPGYNRKDKQLSVEDAGSLMPVLNAMFPAVSTSKKPEPVIFPVPWLAAKAQLYQDTDRIANHILGPPNPPGGGQPPYGFSDDEFKGRNSSIDPRSIVVIQDDNKRRYVLFPIVFVSQRGERRTLWVKATISEPSLLRANQEEAVVIEGMLRKALGDVQSESKAPILAEDQQGRVRTSGDTVAIIGSDRQAVERAILGTS